MTRLTRPEVAVLRLDLPLCRLPEPPYQSAWLLATRCVHRYATWAVYSEGRRHKIGECDELFSVYRDLTRERRTATSDETTLIFSCAKKLARHLLAHRRNRKR